MRPPTKRFKRPESVLIVVYTRTGKVLLLQRHDDPEFWQSVTGSLKWDETEPRQAAVRELWEETGIKTTEGLRDLHLIHRYPILPKWRRRYDPAVLQNSEHAFTLELPAEILITVNPAEHGGYGWFDFDEAVAKVASWTNRDVILQVKGRR